jgi:hypothetical protein
MAFNIKTKALNDRATLTLVDIETDLPLFADDAQTEPLQITLYGKASKQYKSALSKLSKKSQARKGKNATFDESVADNNELLAAISKEAFNFDMGDGVAIDTPEKFLELYSDSSLYWVRDQASAFLEETDSFLQK